MKVIKVILSIAIIIIISIMFVEYSSSFFGSMTTETEKNKVTYSPTEVRFLQPSGTPLTFYRLPDGNYYAILRIQTKTNVTSLPVSFPVPVRSVLISSRFDNKTGLYTNTYAVVIDDKWAKKLENYGVVFLQSTNSNSTYYSVVLTDDPGEYSDVIENNDNGGDNSTTPDYNDVINNLNVAFTNTIVSTPPAVNDRDFDAVVYYPSLGVSSTVGGTTSEGVVYGYALGSTTPSWKVEFTFGYGGTKLVTDIPSDGGNLALIVTNATEGNIANVDGVLISSSSGEYTVKIGSTTYTVTQTPLILVITPDGNVYSASGGTKVLMGTASPFTTSVHVEVYKPYVVVGFTNSTPDEVASMDLTGVESIMTTAERYVKAYANASVSSLSDKVKAEYYSVLNTMGISLNPPLIPTTIASGEYYGKSTYKLYVSPNNIFLETVGGNPSVSSYLARGNVPMSFVSDYVISPNKFVSIQNVEPRTGVLTPTIAPAGTLRFLFFNNLTYIMNNLSWVFQQNTLITESNGYQFTPIYQGGLAGKYVVLTQWNVSDVQPVPVRYRWVGRNVKTWDAFCCFVTIWIEANGINVTINQDPVKTVVMSGDGSHKKVVENTPYSLALLKLAYVNGITCEFSLAGAPPGYHCPMMYAMSYKIFDLYKEDKPVKSVKWDTFVEWYQDHPCSVWDDKLFTILILPGMKLGDIPDEHTIIGDDITVSSVMMWDESWLGVKNPHVYHNFMTYIFKPNYAYSNWKVAYLTRVSG